MMAIHNELIKGCKQRTAGNSGLSSLKSGWLRRRLGDFECRFSRHFTHPPSRRSVVLGRSQWLVSHAVSRAAAAAVAFSKDHKN
jgi:hypothetical protein